MASSQFVRVVCVQCYFDKNRALAMGLVVAGYGCAHLLYGSLARVLSNTFGWRGAVLLGAGMFLQCLPLSAVFRELPAPRIGTNTGRDASQKMENAVGLKEETMMQNQRTSEDCCKRIRKTWCGVIQNGLNEYVLILRDVRFDLLAAGSMLAYVGMTTLFVHTTNRAFQSGIDKTKASLLMSILGAASIFGRLLFSITANSERVSTVLCYGVAAMFGGVVTAAMYWTHTFAELTAGSALGGLFFGDRQKFYFYGKRLILPIHSSVSASLGMEYENSVCC